jgi:hypothetical protein
MKKIILATCLFAISFTSFSQTCEEREAQMLGVMGSLSAGFLYNTYGLIGSIADGYTHDAYTAEAATNLVDAQKKLADNMIVLLENIIRKKAFKDKKDEDYLSSCIAIIKGLKTQAECLMTLVKNNTQKNTNAYEEQRKKNWKDLSKLMGIPE